MQRRSARGAVPVCSHANAQRASVQLRENKKREANPVDTLLTDTLTRTVLEDNQVQVEGRQRCGVPQRCMEEEMIATSNIYLVVFSKI